MPHTTDPRAVVFGSSAESVSVVGIRRVLETYAVPAIAAIANTPDEFRTRLIGILKKHPTIKLIVFNLGGCETPIDFSSLQVTGFQWHQNDNSRNVAMAARKILKIKSPVKIVPKEYSGSAASGRYRPDLSKDFRFGDYEGSGRYEPLDYSIIGKEEPSPSDLAE